jgi:DNA-binding CsgD family transcriptional regulator
MKIIRAELLASRALALAVAGRLDEAEATINPIRGVSRAVEIAVMSAAVDAIVGLRRHEPDAMDRARNLADVAFSTGAVDFLVGAYRASPELLVVLLRSSPTDHRFTALVRRVGDEDLLRAVGQSDASETGKNPPLTEREREVHHLVRQGLTNREIAALLFIAEGTAKRHVQHIFEKLGVRSRTTIMLQAALERSSQATSAIDDTGVGTDSSLL